MMCALGLCLINIAANVQASPPRSAQQPSLQLIKNIEATLVMPPGAHDLATYVRYYSQQIVKRRKFIVATYIYDGSPGRIVIVDSTSAPRIFDSGCDVIELRYSVVPKKVISIMCNGVG